MTRQRIAKSREECCTGRSVVLCLFRNTAGHVRGWHIGPLYIEDGRLKLHFHPKAEASVGSVAIVRALELARQLDTELVIYDPDSLLAEAWAR